MSVSDPAIDQSEQLGTFIRPQHGDLVFGQLTLHPAVRSDLRPVMLFPSV